MGNPHGFLKIKRSKTDYRPACERVKDFAPVAAPRAEGVTREQTSRCMDCGTPFCHWGCPLGNFIPEWNDLTANLHWERALDLLQATNNLPEVTGRVCPALCEFACVLGINDDPVTIRENELAIVEYGFAHGLIKPQPPAVRTGKKVAVVGSGPAGLACAAQLNRAGHLVTVYEKADKIGGLMRYGIPEFKLEKSVLDRRQALWTAEGVVFKCGVNIGVDRTVAELQREHDAVVLAGGSRVPRDLKVPGRELAGIHFALEYLTQPNPLDARGKKVVVIGGGDTGADCVGTAHRQGAACVVQIELLPEPPRERPAGQPWPKYPFIFKTSTSHEEGGERRWSITTKEFKGQKEKVNSLVCARVDSSLKEVPGTDLTIEADLVLLALGFLHPEPINGLMVELDQRGNFKTDQNYMTSVKGIFAAGDMRRGQSLIVWALDEGRRAAAAVNRYLAVT
ncbi:MAG: glutamate synthase subunit beta [Candidatus Margulisbacteria bacterium]|jgi:glutamate synthase (NADPH/NADH) small chain|nr:glutamate synthase subunit beta [Candidatus Margulisiibacteriota bacterium]